MEKSEMQVAAEAARFDDGRNYRKETAPKTFDPSTMEAPKETREAVKKQAWELKQKRSQGAFETDWAGNPVHKNTRSTVQGKHVTRSGLSEDLAPPQDPTPSQKKHCGTPQLGTSSENGLRGLDDQGGWSTTARVMMDSERDQISDNAHHGRRIRRPVHDVPPSTILYERGFATAREKPGQQTKQFGIKPTQSFVSGVVGSVADSIGEFPRSTRQSAAAAAKGQDRDLVLENFRSSSATRL